MTEEYKLPLKPRKNEIQESRVVETETDRDSDGLREDTVLSN